VVIPVLLCEEKFLFDAKPRVLGFSFLHHLVCQMTEIVSSWGDLVVDERFAKGQKSLAILSERVFDKTDGFEPDLGVSSNGLETGRTIVGPPIEVFDGGNGF